MRLLTRRQGCPTGASVAPHVFRKEDSSRLMNLRNEEGMEKGRAVGEELLLWVIRRAGCTGRGIHRTGERKSKVSS